MTIPTNIYPDITPDLNLATLDVVGGAAGPGRRLVLWLQGCEKRCPGCANGGFLAKESGLRVPVAAVVAVLRSDPGCAGITLSGGEPLLQAEPLIPLLDQVRGLGLTSVCYTGYTVEELDEPIPARFLSSIDLLIDGEYRRDLARSGPYRPSSNQRLHFLSGRIGPAECEAAVETEIKLAADRATITGTLPVAVRHMIRDGLRKRGVGVSL